MREETTKILFKQKKQIFITHCFFKNCVKCVYSLLFYIKMGVDSQHSTPILFLLFFSSLVTGPLDRLI